MRGLIIDENCFVLSNVASNDMKLEEEEVEEPLILRFEYTIVMVYLPFLHR